VLNQLEAGVERKWTVWKNWHWWRPPPCFIRTS